MGKKTLQEVIKQNIQLGFDPSVIEIAYKSVGGDSDRIIEEIFRLQDSSTNFPTKPANPQDQDDQLSKAIEMSMNQAKDKKITLEPLNPQQRVRKSGVPVGLKNVGNTCYFNSLLQTYFQNIQFVQKVLSYKIPSEYSKKQKSAGIDENEFKRKQACCRLVQNLKNLFANMIASDRKYIDPTDVITSVVDDYGNEIPFGDQKDIGQFNLVFLSRIDEGLQLGNTEKVIEEKNEKYESPSKIAAAFGQDSQLRMTHRSSIKIEQNSIINNQFIGAMLNSYTNEEHYINQSQEELFSLLFVNVKNKELYKAIEQITIQHIDDYRNEKGQIVGVEKQSWIKKAPKTLFFQIDRVEFNKKTGQLNKINDQFDFPQTFYIDPFLLENKEKALAIQKQVRKLRNQKEKYSNALKELQRFGQKNISLIDILDGTVGFLNHQNTSMQSMQEHQNPLNFASVPSKKTPEIVSLLKEYRQGVEKRIETFESKIKGIESQIQKCYSSMRNIPYHLYSILVHEGHADSGHYYSYTLDIKDRVWRKYNDINISDEVEVQVIREARGFGNISAYYLVYAQEESLTPKNVEKLRNYEVSKSEKYLKDYYSTLLPEELKQKIKTENENLYLEIEQYKMGGLANRVVDSYSKKFETCNQSFRKAKYQKKKNNPPLLINLPLYFKALGLDESYKNSLMANAIQEYGPKQINQVFKDLVKKKIANFNDFKKPKNFSFEKKYEQSFIRSIYKTRAATKLFEALQKEQYRGVFILIKELRSGQSNEYFEWLANLVGKILMITFLIEAEKNMQQKRHDETIQRLRLLLLLGLNHINRNDEKLLISNCFFWSSEISLNLPEELKEQVGEIVNVLTTQGSKQTKYDQILDNSNAKSIIDEIMSSTDIQDSLWNLSRTQNVYVEEMLKAREKIKGKMQVANQLYRQMKKYNIPLTHEQRVNFIKKVRQSK